MSRDSNKRGHRSSPLSLLAAVLISGLLFTLAGIPLPHSGGVAYAQGSGETIVEEMVLCKGVSDREPVEPSSDISLADGRIFTWTKIKATAPPTFIKHVYYRGGKKVAEITLDIKYPTFRTWSYKTLKGDWMLGEWRVEVLSSDDTLLASKEFTVSQ